MATYPGSVFAPAGRSDGQTIFASHVGDLQSEVTAIEDALKNGITHPVSIAGALSVSTGGLTVSTGSVNLGGPSSLATLQVNGTSTFVGAVTFSAVPTFSAGVNIPTFAAPATFSSGITISTGVVRQDSLPSWRVYSSASLAVAAGNSAGVSFDGQTFVRGDIAHSTAANSSRITVTSTGLYRLTYTGAYKADGSAAGQKKITIRFNDSSNVLRYATRRNSSEAGMTVNFSDLVRVDSTGYFSVVIISSGSSPSTHGGTAAMDRITFSGAFVG